MGKHLHTVQTFKRNRDLYLNLSYKILNFYNLILYFLIDNFLYKSVYWSHLYQGSNRHFSKIQFIFFPKISTQKSSKIRKICTRMNFVSQPNVENQKKRIVNVKTPESWRIIPIKITIKHSGNQSKWPEIREISQCDICLNFQKKGPWPHQGTNRKDPGIPGSVPWSWKKENDLQEQKLLSIV